MHAFGVLEFQAIRDRLVAHCETALGAVQASELAPSFEADTVWSALALTTEAHRLLAEAAPPSLGPVRDLRDPVRRAGKGGVLGGHELFLIGDALRAMREMRVAVSGRKEDLPLLWRAAEQLPDLRRLEDALTDALEPNGDVRDAASPHLASLRQRKSSALARVQEKIQAYTTGKTRDLLSDPIVTTRDGRYVVPLKAEHRGRIRGIVHDTSASGQTIYVEPEDVLQLGNLVREIEAAEREEILRVLQGLSTKVGGVARDVSAGIEAAGALDLSLAKARLAYELKGTEPERVQGHQLEIEGGRHPLLDPKTAVPLDLALGQKRNILITGPNTGGKTVAIKTVGLFALMAQSGLFPPARRVRLGPFSQVWADIGDEQSLQQSLSTFSAHVRNISEAIQGLRAGALVLLDEIGAGTDPAEGAALAKAILLAVVERGGVVLASTHYGELKAFAFEAEGFQNAAMEFDLKTLRPTYRLVVGAAGASHALKIAERYGIPKAVVDLAREALPDQHRDMTRMMEGLDQAQRLARQAQSEADRRLAELRRLERQAEERLTEAEEVRRTAHAKATAVVEEALRQIREEAARVFEELKRAGVDARAQERARADLRALQEAGAEFVDALRPKERPQPGGATLKKGMSVRIEGYSQVGTILEEPNGQTATVRVGPLKMTVPVQRLRPVDRPTEERKAKPNLRLQRTQTAVTEIHLRALRAEEAERELERFLDDALLAGVPSVRIVHGKGEGILRKVTQDYLRRSPSVASFRDGEPSEGGQGVTVAVLK